MHAEVPGESIPPGFRGSVNRAMLRSGKRFEQVAEAVFGFVF